jgi:hypothetical protein
MVTWRTTWAGAAEQAAGRAAAIRSGGFSQLPLSTRLMGIAMLAIVVLMLVGLVVIGTIVAIPLVLIGLVVGTTRRLLGSLSMPGAASHGRRNVRVIERRE